MDGLPADAGSLAAAFFDNSEIQDNTRRRAAKCRPERNHKENVTRVIRNTATLHQGTGAPTTPGKGCSSDCHGSGTQTRDPLAGAAAATRSFETNE